MLWTWPLYNWSNSPQDPVLFQNARLINQDSHAQYSDQWSKQIRNKNTKCKWFRTMCWCLHSLRNQALLLRSKATKNRWWLQRTKMTNTYSLLSTLLSLSWWWRWHQNQIIYSVFWVCYFNKFPPKPIASNNLMHVQDSWLINDLKMPCSMSFQAALNEPSSHVLHVQY